MSLRIGIDTGGTFTDVVAFDPATGELFATKTPSVPDDPSEAFVEGLRLILEPAGADVDEVASLSHGTTVATNALLEGDTSGLGLLTTRGFRHVLEIARQSVPDGYGNSYFWVKPDRIVPLHLVREVPERLDARGGVVRALDDTYVAGFSTTTGGTETRVNVGEAGAEQARDGVAGGRGGVLGHRGEDGVGDVRRVVDGGDGDARRVGGHGEGRTGAVGRRVDAGRPLQERARAGRLVDLERGGDARALGVVGLQAVRPVDHDRADLGLVAQVVRHHRRGGRVVVGDPAVPEAVQVRLRGATDTDEVTQYDDEATGPRDAPE